MDLVEQVLHKRHYKRMLDSIGTSPCVYILRLATQKHYYIGSTKNFKIRLKDHMKRKGARATTLYGFSGSPLDVLGLYPCQTRQEAYDLEWALACKYRALFPDAPICSDSYSFGIFNSDRYE